MTRISYSDDETYPGQFHLWQANCRRSLAGKNGQAALRELEAALMALPEKRLIAGAFEDEGDVCPIAAVAKHRGLTATDIKADLDEEMEEVGVELGMPRLVAWKIVALNDIEIDGRYMGTAFIPVTPEDRYERVLAWVRGNIK